MSFVVFIFILVPFLVFFSKNRKNIIRENDEIIETVMPNQINYIYIDLGANKGINKQILVIFYYFIHVFLNIKEIRLIIF